MADAPFADAPFADAPFAANPYQTVSRRGSEGGLVLLPGHTVTSFTSHIHPPKELIQTQRKYLLGKKCISDILDDCNLKFSTSVSFESGCLLENIELIKTSENLRISQLFREISNEL